MYVEKIKLSTFIGKGGKEMKETRVFGFRHAKFEPRTYVYAYRNGKVVRKGLGLAFFYYPATTSIVAVPTSSVEAPFIFAETTSDFQSVTVQGQISYRIGDPARISAIFNYTLDHSGGHYASEDPEKLPEKVINIVKVLVKKEVEKLPLKTVIRSSEKIAKTIVAGIYENTMLEEFGIEVLGLSLLAIKPTKETARALEAETREQILKEADDALYARRNASVEQERTIKENELNTEIAVENKKKQIKEAQMEARRAVQEKEHQLKNEEMRFRIRLEDENKKLVKRSTENQKAEADAKAYGLSAMMSSLERVDSSVIQALASVGMQPEKIIALAFQGLSENASKIGQLNISPELLGELLKRRK